MRLPNWVHTEADWAIAEIVPDFRLLDVWDLPVEGSPDEFRSFLEMMAAMDPTASGSALSRFLFAVRARLGELFGWDEASDERRIPGGAETTLSERLSTELRESVARSEAGRALQRSKVGFSPLYVTDEESAVEISNATVHGVLHFAWVPRTRSLNGAQMAIYVKPRGRLGRFYMLLIEPFRHTIVYPALMRQIEDAWEARKSTSV